LSISIVSPNDTEIVIVIIIIGEVVIVEHCAGIIAQVIYFEVWRIASREKLLWKVTFHQEK
jgi:hypothetical protein